MRLSESIHNKKVELTIFYENKVQPNIPLIMLLIFAFVIIYNKAWTSALATSFNKDDVHFNMLTVNTIFAGFLFTGLGIIISVLDRDALKILPKNYMTNFKNGVSRGIAFNILAVFICLGSTFNTIKTLQPILVFSQFGVTILALGYFTLVIVQLLEIFNEIWNEDSLVKTSKAEDDDQLVE